MRKLLPILLLSFVALSASGKNKERITERGSSLFYRSWRYPIAEEEKEDSVKTDILPQDSLEKEAEITDTLPAISEPIVDNRDITDSDTLATVGHSAGPVAGEEQDKQDDGSSPTSTSIEKCILYFVFDQDNFITDYSAEVDTLLTFIAHHPNERFEVVGHTDERGSISYNQQLSEKRAKKVYDVLVHRGVSSSRLKVTGKGELEPAIPNAKNEEEHQLNRRVELVIVR